MCIQHLPLKLGRIELGAVVVAGFERGDSANESPQYALGIVTRSGHGLVHSSMRLPFGLPEGGPGLLGKRPAVSLVEFLPSIAADFGEVW